MVNVVHIYVSDQWLKTHSLAYCLKVCGYCSSQAILSSLIRLCLDHSTKLSKLSS